MSWSKTSCLHAALTPPASLESFSQDSSGQRVSRLTVPLSELSGWKRVSTHGCVIVGSRHVDLPFNKFYTPRRRGNFLREKLSAPRVLSRAGNPEPALPPVCAAACRSRLRFGSRRTGDPPRKQHASVAQLCGPRRGADYDIYSGHALGKSLQVCGPQCAHL